MLPCYDKALKHISRYPKTKKGLKDYLQRKGYKKEDIDSAVIKLEQQGFVDDKQYAESYIYGSLIKKGKSRYQVIGKLLQKGVDKNLIDALLEEYKDEIREGVLVGAKKYALRYQKRGEEPIKIKQKLFQRGYKSEVVNAIIKEIS